MISSTPKSNFKRYQRLLKQTETSKSSTPIVAAEKAGVLSPKLQKKDDHHHQLSLVTSPKFIDSSTSTTTNAGVGLSTPSPSLMIRCIPSSTMMSPRNVGGGGPAAVSITAAIHAFRMSATPSPLALRIRQQILKSNEKAPATTPTSVLSPKNRSAFFASPSSPRRSSSARGGNTPRASLVSPSVTQKSLNDNNHQSAPGRTCLQTKKCFSASAASFQSPTTLKISSIEATTRPPSAFAKKNLISPASSLQENSSHNRHYSNNGSTGPFDTIPKTLPQATNAASFTKPLSTTTKSNIQASSQTSITKKDVVKKQDGNVDNKDIVAPRSWSHQELKDWLAKHGLLDNNNKSSRIPCHVNGQMVMRMSKAQLLDSFYEGDDCIINKKKAETLFRRLRLESDRADRLQLKKRVAASTKGSASIGK